jgi:hypothetical protein
LALCSGGGTLSASFESEVESWRTATGAEFFDDYDGGGGDIGAFFFVKKF